MAPFVTYGLLLFFAAVVVAGFWLGGRREGTRWAKHSRWSLVMQIGGFACVYLVLRPGTSDDPAELTAAIEQGRPVFIDVYSNF